MRESFLYYSLTTDKSTKNIQIVSEMLSYIFTLSFGIFSISSSDNYIRALFDNINIGSLLSQKSYLNSDFSVLILIVTGILIVNKSFLTCYFFYHQMKALQYTNDNKVEVADSSFSNLENQSVKLKINKDYYKCDENLVLLKNKEVSLNSIGSNEYEYKNYLHPSIVESKSFKYIKVPFIQKIKIWISSLDLKSCFSNNLIFAITKVAIFDSNILVYFENQILLTTLLSCSYENNEYFISCDGQSYIIGSIIIIIALITNFTVSLFYHINSFSIFHLDGYLQNDFLNYGNFKTYCFNSIMSYLVVFYFYWFNKTFTVIVLVSLSALCSYNLLLNVILKHNIYNSLFKYIITIFFSSIHVCLYTFGLIYVLAFVEFTETINNNTIINNNTNIWRTLKLKSINYEGCSTFFLITSLMFSILIVLYKIHDVFKINNIAIYLLENSHMHLNLFEIESTLDERVHLNTNNEKALPVKNIPLNQAYIEANPILNQQEKSVLLYNSLKLLLFHINNINDFKSSKLLINLLNSHKLKCYNNECKCQVEIKSSKDKYFISLKENLNFDEVSYKYLDELYKPYIELINFYHQLFMGNKNIFKNHFKSNSNNSKYAFYLINMIYLTYITSKDFYLMHVLLEELKSLNLSYKEKLSSIYLEITIKSMIKSVSIKTDRQIAVNEVSFLTILSACKLESIIHRNLDYINKIYSSILSSSNINISNTIDNLASIDELNKNLFDQLKETIKADKEDIIRNSLSFNYKFILFLSFFKEDNLINNEKNDKETNSDKDIKDITFKPNLILDYNINLIDYMKHFKLLCNSSYIKDSIPNNKLVIEVTLKPNIDNDYNIDKMLLNKKGNKFKFVIKIAPQKLAELLEYKEYDLLNMEYDLLTPSFLQQDYDNSLEYMLINKNLYEKFVISRFGLTKSNFLVKYELRGAFYSNMNKFYFLACLDNCENFSEVNNKIIRNNNNTNTINALHTNMTTNIAADSNEINYVNTLCCLSDKGNILSFSESFSNEFCVFNEVLEYDDFDFNLFGIIPELKTLCLSHSSNIKNSDLEEANNSNIDNPNNILFENKQNMNMYSNLNSNKHINDSDKNNNKNNMNNSNTSFLDKSKIARSSITNKETGRLARKSLFLGKMLGHNNLLTNQNSIRTLFGNNEEITNILLKSDIKKDFKATTNLNQNNKGDFNNTKHVDNSIKNILKDFENINENTNENTYGKNISKDIKFDIKTGFFKKLLLKNEVYYNLASDYNSKIKKVFNFYNNENIHQENITGRIRLLKSIEFELKKGNFIINKQQIDLNSIYILNIEIFNPKTIILENLNLLSHAYKKNITTSLNNRRTTKLELIQNINNNNEDEIVEIIDFENFIFNNTEKEMFGDLTGDTKANNSIGKEFDDIFIPSIKDTIDEKNDNMHERKNNSLAAKTKKDIIKNKFFKKNKLEISNNNRNDTDKNNAITESSLLGTNKNNNSNNNNNKNDKNIDTELDVNGKLNESDLLDTPIKQNPIFDWILDYIFMKQYYIIHLIFNSILNLVVAILVIISLKNIIDDIVSYYLFNIRNIQIINMNLMSFSMYLLNIGMTTKYYPIDNNTNNNIEDIDANILRSEDILYLTDLLKDHLQYLDSSTEILNEKVVNYYFNNLISYGNDFQGFKNFSYPVFSDYALYLNKTSYTTITTYSIASDIILKEKYISKNIDNNLLSYFLHIIEHDKNEAFQIEKNPLFYNNVVIKFSSFYSYITNMYSLFCSSYLNLLLTSYNYLKSIDSTIALEINAFSILLFLMLAINFGYLVVIKLCCNKINNEFINLIEISSVKITNKNIYLTKALNSIKKYSYEEPQHIDSLVKISTSIPDNIKLLQNQNKNQLENIIEEPNDLDLSENKEEIGKNKAHYLDFLKKNINCYKNKDNLNNKLLNTVNSNTNKKAKNALSISSQADLIPMNTKKSEADLTTEVKTKSFSDIYHFPHKLLVIIIVFILLYLICLIIFLSVSLLYLNTKSDKFKENITLNYSFLSQVFSSSYLLQTYFPKFDIGDFSYAKNDFLNDDNEIDSTAYYNNAYFLKNYVEKSIEFYKFDNNTLPEDYVNYINIDKFNISTYFSIIQNEIFQTLDNSVSFDNSNSERISSLTLNQKNSYAKNFNLRSLVSNSICNIKELNEIISGMPEEYDELIQATFNVKSIEFINSIYSFYNLCDGSSDNKNIDSFSYFIMNNYLNELLITTKEEKNTNYSTERSYISDKYEIKNYMIFLATSYSYYLSSTFISYKYITDKFNMSKQLLIAINLLILFSSFTINIIIAYFFYKSRNKVSKYKKYILISNNINE